MLVENANLNLCFLVRDEGIRCLMQLGLHTVDASRGLLSQNRNKTSIAIATTSSWQSYL